MSLATVFNYFANSLWQVPLLAGCCWCALRLARASAGVRYGAWIATLLLCVALPWRGAVPARDGTVTVSTGFAVVAPRTAQALPALPFYAVCITPRTRDFLAEGYLALTAMLLLRLMISYAAQRRLVRRAGFLSAGQAVRVAALDVDAGRVSVLPDGHSIPLVAGVWRPRVLVPEALLASDEETLRAVLAHEFAHLARRDTLVNLALRVVALPVAYHPATGLIEREIQHARELLCDAVAARSLSSAAAYAQALLRLARELVHTGGKVPGSTVGLFARTSKPLLEERIMNLITPPAPLRPGFRWMRVSAGVAVFCAATAAASVMHLTPSVAAASLPAVQGQSTAATTAVVATPNAAPVKEISCAQRAEQNMISCAAEDAEAASTLRNSKFKRQFTGLMDPRGTDSVKWQKEFGNLSTKMKSQDRGNAVAEVEVMEMTQFLAQHDPSFREKLREKRWQETAAPGQEKVASVTAPFALAKEGAASGQDAEPALRAGADVMEGAVSQKVMPVYPPIAKAAKVSGTVVFRAVIGKDGTVQNLQYVSGPEMLKSATIEALRQWVYRPYLLNGQPTAVETTVSVTYSLPE